MQNCRVITSNFIEIETKNRRSSKEMWKSYDFVCEFTIGPGGKKFYNFLKITPKIPTNSPTLCQSHRSGSFSRNSSQFRRLSHEKSYDDARKNWWASQCEIYVCILYAVHLCTTMHSSWFPNYFFGPSTLIYILFDLYFHLKRYIELFFSCSTRPDIVICAVLSLRKSIFTFFLFTSPCAFLGGRKFGNKASIAGAKSRLIGCFVSKWQGEAQKKAKRNFFLMLFYFIDMHSRPLRCGTQRA